MSLDEKFIPIRIAVYQIIENCFKKIAALFGYPQNPGMPTIYEMPNETYRRSQFSTIFQSIKHIGLQYNNQKLGLK